MNKKITILIVIICTLVVEIGVSLAYFAVNNQNDGNETNLNITTERLGSILWTGTKVFTSYDLLPGQIGIQEFTIEKNSDNGVGIYEIDLAGVLPSEFGTDIEISLYKTTEPDTNNVTVNESEPTLENQQIFQNDSLNITGTPELVYQGTLTNNTQTILEQADFDYKFLTTSTSYESLINDFSMGILMQYVDMEKMFMTEESLKKDTLERIKKINRTSKI